MTPAPSHIRHRIGDRASLCGVTDPAPVTWAPWVARHTHGRDAEWCPACHALWLALPDDDRAEPQRATQPNADPQQGVLL